MDSPKQPYIPATTAILGDWLGPVSARSYGGGHLFLDGVLSPMISRIDGERVVVSNINANVWSVSVDKIRLDARRREVQNLICDRINLPAWQGRSEWCAAMVWWAGMTGRPLWAVLSPWKSFHNPHCEVFYRTSLPVDMSGLRVADDDGWMCRYGVGNNYMVHGRETGADGKTAADAAALAHDCAIINESGERPALTLPPLTPGGPPVIWIPTCLPK